MSARAIALVIVGACGSPHPTISPDGSTLPSGDDAAPGSDGSIPLRPTTFALFAQPQLAADTSVLNRVVVVGTHDDDHTIATDAVVLGFDRPGAGSFTRPMVTLGELGAESDFIPCAADVPGCLGTLTLTVALATNPSVVVATLPVQLVEPSVVNPAKACLVGGNMLALHGNDQIFTGDTTITDAAWDSGWAYQNSIIFNVTPTGATDHWQLAFDAQEYSSSFVPDIYLNADKATPQTASLERRDYPALAISGFGHECDTVTGQFQIEDYSVNNSGARDITITFEQHCNGDPTSDLTGCLHYQPTMAKRAPAPPASYEVRIAETAITANGHTKHEVFVFGKHPDGTTSQDAVVLGLDRASAGTLESTALGLGPLGARTYFTPCEAHAVDCLGPAVLTVALASDPTTIVATRNIALDTAGHISTVAPCLVGGDVMYLDGNNGIRDGMLTVRDGSVQSYPSATDFLYEVSPGRPTEGLDWFIYLDSLSYGSPIAPGIFVDVDQWHHADPGHLGMSVGGNAHSCGALSGAVEIVDFDATSGAFTLGFEQHCDGEAPLLEGCFHHGS